GPLNRDTPHCRCRPTLRRVASGRQNRRSDGGGRICTAHRADGAGIKHSSAPKTFGYDSSRSHRFSLPDKGRQIELMRYIKLCFEAPTSTVLDRRTTPLS